jgi:diadenosine tetraphosphate (Ap4A) HIT family hydrolase
LESTLFDKSLRCEARVAVLDEHPVTKGYTLVIPCKDVGSTYELAILEQQGIWNLLAEVRERLLTGRGPDGFNIGFNKWLAASQTVMHARVCVIPVEPATLPVRTVG